MHAGEEMVRLDAVTGVILDLLPHLYRQLIGLRGRPRNGPPGSRRLSTPLPMSAAEAADLLQSSPA